MANHRPGTQAAGIVLAFAAAVGSWRCEGPKQGREHCPWLLDDYEAADRPAVSPVTGVETDVPVEPEDAGPDCCLDDYFMNDGSDYPPIPRTASRYPWAGHSDELNQAATCNTCPYGRRSIQGVWGDTNLGMPATVYSTPLPFVTRIEVDGNTFRWRGKNVASGQWVDFRGYYFCIESRRQFLVPLLVERGQGVRCVSEQSDAEDRPEQFPTIAVGIAIAVGMSGELATDFGLGQFKALSVTTADDAAGQEIPFYCHPGEIVGDLKPEYVGIIDPKCPDDDVFFECWDLDERERLTPLPSH